MVVFNMRDSVPSARYCPICYVLRLWGIWLIPTYRVYRLYETDSLANLGRGGHRGHMPPPLSQELFSSALSLALLRMRARRSARAAPRMCVGGDSTNAYMYRVYALVGGQLVFVIRISVPFHESVRTID